MAIVQNGRSPVAIRWVDQDGIEHAIVQVRLGDRLVFDGTVPALVQVPAAEASGEVFAPLISAGQTIAAPQVTGVGETYVPRLVGGARILPTPASASGEVYPPTISAGATVQVEAATGDGLVNIPSVGVTAQGEVVVEIATGSGEVYAPTIAVPGTVLATMASGEGETFAPAARGAANVYAPTATGSGEVYVSGAAAPALYPGESLYPGDTVYPSDGSRPLVQAGANIAVPTATGDGSVPTPLVPVYGIVRPTVASGTGVVLPPTGVGRIGVQFSDNFNRANGTLTTPWLRRVSWTYSDFGITSNQLYRTDGGANDSADGSDAYIYVSPTVTTDQFAQLSINTITGFPSAGVVLGTNADGTAAGLWAEVSTTGWRIFSAVPASGSKTILASGSGTYTAGGVLRLEKSGTLATLIYKGAVLGTYSGTLPSGLYVGVRAGQGSCRSDDWSGGDL